MRFLVSVKFPGGNAEFFGPFESQEQAENWAAKWAGTTIVLPLQSPWDA